MEDPVRPEHAQGDRIDPVVVLLSRQEEREREAAISRNHPWWEAMKRQRAAMEIALEPDHARDLAEARLLSGGLDNDAQMSLIVALWFPARSREFHVDLLDREPDPARRVVYFNHLVLQEHAQRHPSLHPTAVPAVFRWGPLIEELPYPIFPLDEVGHQVKRRNDALYLWAKSERRHAAEDPTAGASPIRYETLPKRLRPFDPEWASRQVATGVAGAPKPAVSHGGEPFLELGTGPHGTTVADAAPVAQALRAMAAEIDARFQRLERGPQRPEQQHCKTFAKTGRCRYGAKCIYKHTGAARGGQDPPQVSP